MRIKMNKKMIFVFIVAGLLIVAGCEGGRLFGKGSKDTKPLTDADVRKGVQGLTMDFVQNAPPERIFENTAFPIVVNLKNMGAFDIGDNENTPDITERGGVLVFGFEKAYVGVATPNDKSKQEFDVKGRSIYNPDGDEEFRELNAKTKEIGAQSETQPSTIFATACYPYQTILGASVCVDTDVYDIGKGKKACAVKDLVFAEGQGAPVAITKIETRMFPDGDKVKPHFIIYIENKGNGEVIKLNKVDTACSSGALDYEDFNAIDLVVSLSDKNLNCNVGEEASESTEIRLRGKEDMVRCTLNEGVDIGRDAYITPLKIELNYGYTFTISKGIIIEKVLTH
jgi:hypothetical protein